MIDISLQRYLIFIDTSRVPDLLHYLECLKGRHFPGVRGLTDKGHVRRDERLPEPFRRDIVGHWLSIRSFIFFFGGLAVGFNLSYNVLDWQ